MLQLRHPSLHHLHGRACLRPILSFFFLLLLLVPRILFQFFTAQDEPALQIHRPKNAFPRRLFHAQSVHPQPSCIGPHTDDRHCYSDSRSPSPLSSTTFPPSSSNPYGIAQRTRSSARPMREPNAADGLFTPEESSPPSSKSDFLTQLEKRKPSNASHAFHRNALSRDSFKEDQNPFTTTTATVTALTRSPTVLDQMKSRKPSAGGNNLDTQKPMPQLPSPSISSSGTSHGRNFSTDSRVSSRTSVSSKYSVATIGRPGMASMIRGARIAEEDVPPLPPVPPKNDLPESPPWNKAYDEGYDKFGANPWSAPPVQESHVRQPLRSPSPRSTYYEEGLKPSSGGGGHHLDTRFAENESEDDGPLFSASSLPPRSPIPNGSSTGSSSSDLSRSDMQSEGSSMSSAPSSADDTSWSTRRKLQPMNTNVGFHSQNNRMRGERQNNNNDSNNSGNNMMIQESPEALTPPPIAKDLPLLTKKKPGSLSLSSDGSKRYGPPPRSATAPLPARSCPKGRCKGCGELIMGKSVSSADGRLTGRYHKACFVCYECQAPFLTTDFYVHDDHPYCAYHYHRLNGSLCSSCDRGIEGQYLETVERTGRGPGDRQKFHPYCLRCCTCHVSLRGDYYEWYGQVYCEQDIRWVVEGIPPQQQQQQQQQQNSYAPATSSPLHHDSSEEDYGDQLAPPPSRGLRRAPERRTTRLMVI